MKEHLLRIGFGLGCIMAACVTLAIVLGLFMLLGCYPIPVGIVAFMLLAWIIGTLWREL